MKQAVMVRAGTLGDLLSGTAGNLKRSLEDSGHHAYYAYPAIALFSVNTAAMDLWSGRNAFDELYAVIKRYGPGNTAVLPDDKGHVGVIFSWDNRDSIIELHSKICSHEYRLNPQLVTLGISNPVSHLSDLHHGYEQALHAMQHRFYQNHSQPVYFSSITEYARDTEYPKEMEDELLHLLIEHSITKSVAIRQAVEGFYEALTKSGPLPVNKVVDATLQLLVSLQLRLKSALGQPHLCSTPDITALMQLQSLAGMKDKVCEAINGMEGTPYASDSLNRNLIKKAVTLMEEEYDRASLHYVAEKVFITPAYLSALFKSKMGVTFIEHLTCIRISNAKKLLKQTHLKNYEVAERVGYNDSRYFSQIFKKKVGLSPSDYRDAN
ncbi:hypothetical protein MU1_09940 [Paenibacillus glycanilyticus]|uniref:HTH araC/xylS-type domain-containing protein n=2 Tax=Paenibacillus glycanilyticus TaxID=126569 RepID=A0ABQ6G8Q6_9BACL|nr:hypothetical protein MU1_09940 [Paenibacillus glycanilyticus]